MSRKETVTLTNMCMVYKGDQILVQNRKKAWRGIAFPGGHLEKGESFVNSVIREVFEETGLTIVNPQICGIKHFYDRADHRYIVILYKANQFSGELIHTEEGENFWINIDDLHRYELAEDFEELLDVFFDNDKNEMMYIKEDNYRMEIL